jgi:hypothetical protein
MMPYQAEIISRNVLIEIGMADCRAIPDRMPDFFETMCRPALEIRDIGLSPVTISR